MFQELHGNIEDIKKKKPTLTSRDENYNLKDFFKKAINAINGRFKGAAIENTQIKHRKCLNQQSIREVHYNFKQPNMLIMKRKATD